MDSYNDFVENQLNDIIKQFNDVAIYHDFQPEHNKHKNEIHITFGNIHLGRPINFENDGSCHPLSPEIARYRNMTYSSSLQIDTSIKIIKRSGDNLENEDVFY